jgi:tRNA threonylcarbamoyladenosine biosynthesis protein TsaB
MLVLAIETATDLASVVLAQDDRELAAWRALTGHALCQRLAAEITRVLGQAGRSLADVDLIAVGLGPGSFTSLRVGLATAKGFAFARQRPLVGVCSLAAIAWQARERVSGLICPVTDAKRGELYAAVYRVCETSVDAAVPPFVASPEELLDKLVALREMVTLVGQTDRAGLPDAISSREGRLRLWGEGEALPDAMAVSQLGKRRYAEKGGDQIGPLRPIYVRMSYAEEAAKLDLGLR